MAEAMRIVRPVFSLLLIGASILGLINVYGDTSDVLSQAKQVACGSKECETQLTEVSRNPIAHTYHLVARDVAKKGSTLTHVVKCERAQLLIGDWHCTDQK
jgi:hypothetical protein